MGNDEITGEGGKSTFFGLEFDDSRNGPENFLLDDLHVGLAIRNNGRLDKVSLTSVSLTTSVNGCAVLASGIEIPHDTLKKVGVRNPDRHRDPRMNDVRRIGFEILEGHVEW